MKQNRKGQLLQGVAFATLFILLLSCCVAGIFARYTSSAFGADEARGARWDVSLKNTESTLTLNASGKESPKESAEYRFAVVSHSEVDASYSVRLEFNHAPLANVSLQMSDGTVSQVVPCDGTQRIFTFEGFSYAVGDAEKELVLLVTVDYIATDENGESTLIEFNRFTDQVKIFLLAEQKMPAR